jgi:hypothetical protein
LRGTEGVAGGMERGEMRRTSLHTLTWRRRKRKQIHKILFFCMTHTTYIYIYFRTLVLHFLFESVLIVLSMLHVLNLGLKCAEYIKHA